MEQRLIWQTFSLILQKRPFFAAHLIIYFLGHEGYILILSSGT